MFLGMKVHHEVDERSFKPGGQPGEQGEAGAGKFGGPFEIKIVLLFADLPMRFRCKRELRFASPFSHFHIIAVVLASGYRVMTDIWYSEHDILEP